MSGRHALAVWLLLMPFLAIALHAAEVSLVGHFLLGGMLGVGCALMSSPPYPRRARPPIRDGDTDQKFNDLAAYQFGQIKNLELALEVHKRAIDDVRMSMICIGGPLNDNKLGYTAEQRKPFHRIEQMIEGLGSEYDPHFDGHDLP